MANWAKLQEDLTGLPVWKRAKYGIHFKRPDGQIEAVLTGKPCHYQDGSTWKPIDTALLTTADGWYSSPHSDVAIHPDGRVRVKDSDYQQFAELPGAKVGKLAGDKIIREFPGGEQHLVMKEDGFREEIHVFKPTLKLEKFIAKTTGNLPSKYKARPITAEDAEGNSYTFTGDTKAFGAWLDKAVYPVVIDPDFTSNSATGDVALLSGGVANNNYGLNVGITQVDGRALIRFDLSAISVSDVISAASLKLTKISSVSSSLAQTLTMYKVTDANGDWIEGLKSESIAGAGEPCWNAKCANGSGGVTTAWAGSAGCSTAGTDYVNTSLGSVGTNRADAVGTEYTIVINSNGFAVLQDWFGDVTNNGFLLRGSAGFGHATLASTEHTTASIRPVLTVTYTSGGIPKHFMHYQRLRG